MSKEKLIKLTKYASEVKSKLTDRVPEKHKNREAQYKQFLQKELYTTNNKIEALKMSLPAEGKK